MAVEQKQEKALGPPIKKYEPPEGMTKQQIIDEYHKLAYSAAYEEGLTWQRTQWLGFPVYKNPSDLFNLVDVIWQTKPQLVIETGTAASGSALFIASFLDAMCSGKVLSIDISPVNRAHAAHPRIAYLGGKSSVDKAVLNEVQTYVASYGPPVMVILDSDHSQEHVLKELDVYGGFVTPGAYLVLEDSEVNGHPVLPEHGPGPYEALEEWLPKHPEFRQDTRVASYQLFSAHSWLRKVRV